MAAAKFNKCCFAILLIFSAPHLNWGKPVSSELQSLIAATSKIAHYCKSVYMELNLDAIFGLRIAEGQLTRVLNAYQGGDYHQSLPQSVLEELQSTRAELTSTANSAIPHLHDAEKTYFLNFKEMVAKPWLQVYPYRNLKRTTDRLDPIAGPGIDEDMSDNCLKGVLGSGGHDSCTVSPECLYLMTTKGETGYPLTHQLLYLMIANQECPHILEEKLAGLKKDLASLLNSFSEQLLLEIIKEYPPTEPNQDLFIEQVLIGTQLGYLEFFQTEWMQAILSWQFPSGCFGQEGKSLQHHPKRKILVEKSLKDGCLSHSTGIAAALLASYLRHSIHFLFTSEERQEEVIVHQVVEPGPIGPAQSNEFVLSYAILLIYISSFLLLCFMWKKVKKHQRQWTVLQF